MQNSFGISRRRALARMGAGFGSLALAGLCSRTSIAAPASPLSPKPAHFSPRAKRVIFLFMEGGPSHLDLFDHKPDLAKFHDTKLPFNELPREIREGKAEVPENFGNLLGPIATFSQ